MQKLSKLEYSRIFSPPSCFQRKHSNVNPTIKCHFTQVKLNQQKQGKNCCSFREENPNDSLQPENIDSNSFRRERKHMKIRLIKKPFATELD